MRHGIVNAHPEYHDQIQELVDAEVNRLWKAEQRRRLAAQEVAQIEEALKCGLMCLLPTAFLVIFFWN